MTYTHVGHHLTVGHVLTGRLHGHRDHRGRMHALNGCANIYAGASYLALCGEEVRAADDGGYRLTVRPASATDGQDVGCRRCLRVIRAAARNNSGKKCN